MTHGRHHGSLGRGVTGQLVDHELSWHATLALQQLAEEPDSRSPIATRLHQDVDHVAVLVDGPPQVLLPAPNPYEQFIEIPRVPLAAPPAPQSSSVLEPEGCAPLPDRFVRDVDAALGEKVLDVSKTEAESVTDLVREHFGLDGTGVTVGILSDSYDCLGGAAADIASGDLPAPANFFVLDDSFCPGTDEARAIGQIIHDIAPGAVLGFHTAGGGQANFATGITELAAAGADVIVDDHPRVAGDQEGSGVNADRAARGRDRW